MGIITISISDETEFKFREAVKVRMGTGKGKIGKAEEEAMKKWAQDNKAEEHISKAIEMMKKGLYKVGKDYTFKRQDAYDE